MTCPMLPPLAVGLLLAAVPAAAQPPNTVTRESTITSRVERVERSIRVVTLRSREGAMQSVYVDPSVTAFDSLKEGDLVTVHYTESVVVQVKRGAKPSEARDTTDAAREAGHPNVTQQTRAVVTIEDVSPDGLAVSYRTADGRLMSYAVSDKKLVAGLHHGDRVEVTLTRQRAISIEPGR
jgi:Cu/Ag efflux protein CusF